MKDFRKWLNEGSIFGFRASYSLTHPNIIIEGIYNEIRWSFQRIFHGYDDRIIWSIDCYLARMIPIWMKKLRDNKIGIPVSCIGANYYDENYNFLPGQKEKAEAHWNAILNNIIAGFEAYLKNINFEFKSEEEMQEGYQKFKAGFYLFEKYFGNFWD